MEPALADDALLADFEAAEPRDGIVLWWLGQCAFLVKSAAGRVLFDPHPADSRLRTPVAADRSCVGNMRLAIAPGRLRSIDVVTSSHGHAGDSGIETLTEVFSANPKAAFVVPEARRKFLAERLGCDPAWPWGLNGGESLSFGDITVFALPAAHAGIDCDAVGGAGNLGYVVWFGNLKVYHGGDTPCQRELAGMLRPLSIDVALLPITGNPPERSAAGAPLGDEAAQLAHDVGARLVVPFHGDRFALNAEPTVLFQETCLQLGRPCKTLRPGERLWLGRN